MTEVDTELDLFAQRQPEACQLAKAVSLAARVEPEVLRAVRLQLPELDAGSEADVWFSPFVESANAVAMTFKADAAAALRRRLAREHDRNYISRIWSIINRIHEHASNPIRLIERLTWLALTNNS